MTVINKNLPLNEQMPMSDIRNTKKIRVDGSAGNSSLPRRISILNCFLRWALPEAGGGGG